MTKQETKEAIKNNSPVWDVVSDHGWEGRFPDAGGAHRYADQLRLIGARNVRTVETTARASLSQR